MKIVKMKMMQKKKAQEEIEDSIVTISHPCSTPSHAPRSTFTLWN